ncbi:MAG: hypothetical protein E6I88_13675 [Chloroflexi bacterium]|nr:MAG: hypothetical protein E6I88_13675 [Chloroflexota bacterium]
MTVPATPLVVTRPVALTVPSLHFVDGLPEKAMASEAVTIRSGSGVGVGVGVGREVGVGVGVDVGVGWEVGVGVGPAVSEGEGLGPAWGELVELGDGELLGVAESDGLGMAAPSVDDGAGTLGPMAMSGREELFGRAAKNRDGRLKVGTSSQIGAWASSLKYRPACESALPLATIWNGPISQSGGMARTTTKVRIKTMEKSRKPILRRICAQAYRRLITATISRVPGCAHDCDGPLAAADEPATGGRR